MSDRDDRLDLGSLNDLGDLGSLSEGASLSDVALDAPRLSHALDEDIDLDAVPMSELLNTGSAAPAISLPCNAATQECQRGPCEHLWQWLLAMPAQAEVVTVQRTQACMRHEEIRTLVDENVFRCEQWWPGPLGFVPASLRPLLRPRLRKMWVSYLAHVQKLDFGWQWWPENVFDLTADEVYNLRQRAVKAIRAQHSKEEAPPTP